jgi:hypothetical protein
MRPVILIPGIGGSALVKINHQTKHVFKKEVIDNRWINLGFFSMSKRWKEDMTAITYKKAGDRYVGMVAGDTTTFDFGGTRGVTNLFPELHGLSDRYNEALDPFLNHRYFGSLCDVLKKRTYKDHHDLFGAPYDFRLILDPTYREKYFNRLEHGIKQSVEMNCERALLVTHSFGGVLLKWFLGTKDQDWVDKYIHHWVCVSAPFGGSLLALLFLMANTKSIFTKDLEHQWEKVSSIIACFPNIDSSEPLIRFKDGHELFVATYSAQASISRVPQLQIYNDLYAPHHLSVKRAVNIPATFVQNVATATPYMQDKDSIRYTKGDGVVTEKSLLAYNGCVDNARDVVINNCNHTSILLHKHFHETVLRNL